MAFLVSGKIEFLCLFAIQDEVTGKKSSDLGGNYFETEKASKIWHVNKFCITFSQLQDSLNKSRTSKK